MSNSLSPETIPLPATNNCLLAGDIGATKTSLALFPHGQGLQYPLSEATFENAAASFEELVAHFLKINEAKPDIACFGVAGPVRNNQVKMTNLDWTLDGTALQNHFGIRSVILINDLVATASGALQLPAESLLTINKSDPDPVGTICVIAPGTGLGEAFLIWHGDHWLPVPSEGGHSSFAPTTDQQRRLLQRMSKQHSHVSTEMVCSGLGIPNLYNFLCEEQQVENLILTHPDPTRIIVENALTALEKIETQSIELQTIQLFVSILASESANLALKTLATGGIYIGGGIPPRILPFLQPEIFMQSFARGESRDILTTFPVHVILEPKAALIGAATYGRVHTPAAGESK